jgi:hypothetical protein
MDDDEILEQDDNSEIERNPSEWEKLSPNGWRHLPAPAADAAIQTL